MAVPLQTGVYDIHCNGMCYISPIYSTAQLLILPASIQVSNEPWVHRLISHSTVPPVEKKDSGKESVTATRNCVISGTPNPEYRIQVNNWAAFGAAHIFPLGHESHWIQYDYGRWVTDMK
ncbi:hypothetical protein HOY80DRAFT_1068873 [Tuber brumale]|nr:hypothetical protein HOY80DRAFT_1068873 [Tuber brumale]